jgi:hypothetical protein
VVEVQPQYDDDPVPPVLNLTDPFEAFVAEMVAVYRDRRDGYSHDGDAAPMFAAMADEGGVDAAMAARMLARMKLYRVGALSRNGRAGKARDSYVDAANYVVHAAVLAEG